MSELWLCMAMGCVATTSLYVSWLHWRNREWAMSVFTMVVVDLVLALGAVELLSD